MRRAARPLTHPGPPWTLPGGDRAVFYQIYPRSFAPAAVAAPPATSRASSSTSTTSRWLGVDAVWLSPFYPSPMADFGYDVADYCDVDPLFGDLATFDRLLAACHERDLQLLVDLVPNHTSDQHPWFRAARSSRDDPKRDWYVWRDGDAGHARPTTGSRPSPTSPAWTWDEATGQWYLHQFLPEQPDLNWANPEVVEAMHGVMRFWLDRGVDGFRIDVVHGIGKDPALPDDPPEVAGIPHSALNDTAETHELHPGHAPAGRRLPGRPADPRRGVPAVDRAGGHVLRRRRRAAPGVQLPAPVHAVGRRAAGARQIADDHATTSTPRRLADVGAVQPRQRPPPHPLRRLGGRGPGRGVPAARPARARRSSTPARSWASRTPSSRPIGSSTPAAATAAGRRSRGRRPRPRLGRRPTPGCRGRPTPTTRNVAALRADDGFDPPPLPAAAGGPPGLAGAADRRVRAPGARRARG